MLNTSMHGTKPTIPACTAKLAAASPTHLLHNKPDKPESSNILHHVLLFFAAQNGSWDEVSGEAFLRKLLSMPISEAKFNTVSSLPSLSAAAVGYMREQQQEVAAAAVVLRGLVQDTCRDTRAARTRQHQHWHMGFPALTLHVGCSCLCAVSFAAGALNNYGLHTLSIDCVPTSLLPSGSTPAAPACADALHIRPLPSAVMCSQGRDSLFDNVRSCGVDPRSIAQRIMDIRTQLSEEFIQELQAIAEENSLLLR